MATEAAAAATTTAAATAAAAASVSVSVASVAVESHCCQEVGSVHARCTMGACWWVGPRGHVARRQRPCGGA